MINNTQNRFNEVLYTECSKNKKPADTAGF